MELFKERLAKLVELFGENKLTIFAMRCGVPKSNIYRYLNGTSPRPEHLVSISRYTKYSIDWLLTGSRPSELVRKVPPCHVDQVCQDICHICKELDAEKRSMVLKMIEPLMDFKIQGIKGKTQGGAAKEEN
jgi:hypothetical protein